MMLLERVQQWGPGHSEDEVIALVAELFREYVAAQPDTRRALRTAAQQNPLVAGDYPDEARRRETAIPTYLRHLPAGAEADPMTFVRTHLIAMSLTGGEWDWQGTMLNLQALRTFAEAHGVDPGPIFVEIAATAADDDPGTREICMRELFLSKGDPEVLRTRISDNST